MTPRRAHPDWALLSVAGWLVANMLTACGSEGSTLCLPVVRPCQTEDPLPTDQTGLMKWMWRHYEDASDELMHDALGNLHAALQADGLVHNRTGSLDDLGAEDVAGVHAQGDPALCTGLMLAGVMDCSLTQVDQITVNPNQMEMYPGVYDSYERTYQNSIPDYVERSHSRLDWTLVSTGVLLGSHYTLHYGAGNRWIPARQGGNGTGDGDFLLTRSWMLEPGTFDSQARAMDQDYQVEVYYHRTDGKVVHLWAAWRQVRMGTLTNDDPVVMDTLVSNMESWDDQTRQLCADNKPGSYP